MPISLRKRKRINAQIMNKSFILFENVEKVYHMGEVEIKAVGGANFSIDKGEFTVIVGPSGAGKTTILNMLGGMDNCTGGRIVVDDREVSGSSARALTQYRRYDIGFVFQFYNLVQNLTALENVELASQICRDPLDARTVMREVGLEERMNNFPSQLSGGEQQRVAIARALAKNPKLLLCDEPTGALDYVTGKQILALLQKTCRDRGMTVIVITHNLALTPMADKVIHIRNGKVEKTEINDRPLPVTDAEGSKYLDALVGEDTVTVFSMPDKINKLRITQGREPQSSSECVVEQLLADKLEIAVGDTITINTEDADEV